MRKSKINELLRRINRVKKRRSKSLDISGLNLHELPVEVKELAWLKILKCDHNHLEDLNGIEYLKSLEVLSCTNNKIQSLIGVKRLTSLKFINCRKNQINSLEGVEELTALNNFYCCHNEIKSLAEIKNSIELDILTCSFNQLSNLNSLENCILIHNLKCSDNLLTSLQGIRGANKLVHLDCSNNQIRSVDEVASHTTLISINCSKNPLEFHHEIRSILQNNELKEVNLVLCENIGIPRELISAPLMSESAKWYHNKYRSNNLNLLIDYFVQGSNGMMKGNSFKILFVGNGRVGKSTLAYCLENKKAPENKLQSTHGVSIQRVTSFDEPSISYNVQLLDFGGQEIYHAVHRLFFASNAIYLALWAEETDEVKSEFNHDLSYWLNLINLHGKDSEIIVIKNQIDRKNELALTHPALSDCKFESIQQLGISAREYFNVKLVRTAISELLSKLSEKSPLIPINWLEINKWISCERKKAVKLINYQQFEKKCKEVNINRPQSLAKYLDKSGECIYLEHEKMLIIDRNWGVEAVYKLFEAGTDYLSPREYISNNNGEAHKSVIKTFLADYINEFELIFGLMKKVNICFRHPRYAYDSQTYIFPSLLNKEPQSLAYQTGYTLKCQFTLPAYHRLVIEDFIRVTSHLSKKSYWWFNGIEITVIEHNCITTATIVACPEKATITVFLSGDQEAKLLKKIKNTLYLSEFFCPTKELICIPSITSEWVDVRNVSESYKARNERVISETDEVLNCLEYNRALSFGNEKKQTLERSKAQEDNFQPPSLITSIANKYEYIEPNNEVDYVYKYHKYLADIFTFITSNKHHLCGVGILKKLKNGAGSTDDKFWTACNNGKYFERRDKNGTLVHYKVKRVTIMAYATKLFKAFPEQFHDILTATGHSHKQSSITQFTLTHLFHIKNYIHDKRENTEKIFIKYIEPKS